MDVGVLGFGVAVSLSERSSPRGLYRGRRRVLHSIFSNPLFAPAHTDLART